MTRHFHCLTLLFLLCFACTQEAGVENVDVTVEPQLAETSGPGTSGTIERKVIREGFVDSEMDERRSFWT